MNTDKKSRFEFIEQMMDKLDSISIEKFIEKRISLKPDGRHYLGLCPFHNDTKLGSFVVTPGKFTRGVFKCFTCNNVGGNGIKFISMYDNISYLEAAFSMALDFNLISLSDYELYSRSKYSSDYIHAVEKRHNIEKKECCHMLEKASADVLNNVYSYFKELAGISEHHLSQLKDERKLSEDRIRSDYFTFPTSMKNHYICEIQKKYPNYTDDVLLHVPGFYKENGKIQFYAVKGIGILIHDLPGRVQAIQIRRDTIKEGQKRYTWFSSTFAAYDDKYEGGLSCGAPKDILLPNETRKSTLCITEGRFKSEILCAAGNIALSVQGVGAWHGIETNINEIMQIKHVSRLFLLFDTDMLGNSAVMDQMIALYNVLSSTFPSLKISAGVWAKQDGKGIDDLFINHKAVTAKFLDPSYIAETQNKQNLSLLSKYGYKSIRDIPKNKVDTFKFELQCECEKVLL